MLRSTTPLTVGGFLELGDPRTDSTAPIAMSAPMTPPERFLIKVRVDGPDSLGRPSVEGLQASDFNRYVGIRGRGNEAPILSGSYVQVSTGW